MSVIDLATYSYTLELNDRNFTRGMNEAERKVNRLQGELGGFSNFLNTTLVSAISAVGVGLVGLGTAATIGFGKAVEAAKDFEQAMAEAKSVMSPDEIKQFSGQLKELAMTMGAETKYSATEAAAGIKELLAAGVSTEQILNGGLKGALSLASAGGLELADAAEIASTALNAFKDDALSVQQSADILAGAANASATSVGELKFGLSSVSAVAASVGMSFNDTSTALGLFAQNGLKGSDAGTSLKTMLMTLQPSTEDQIYLFKQLGLTAADGTSKFFDATGSLKSLAEISDILRNSMKDLNEAQRLQAMQTIFGTDAIRASNILFKEGAEGVNKMALAMGRVTADQTAAIKMDTTRGAIEQMTGSIQTAAIQFGETFLPAIRDAAEGVDEFISGLSKNGDVERFAQSTLATLTEVGSMIVEIAKTIKEHWAEVSGTFVGVATAMISMKVIGSVVTLWEMYRAAVASATIAQLALNAAVMVNPYVAAATAIGVVAAAIWSYSQQTDKATESSFRFAQSQEELRNKLSTNDLDRNTNEVKALQEDIETLNQLLEKRAELESRLNTQGKDQLLDSSQLVAKNKERKEALADLKAIDEQLKVFGISTPDKAPEVLKRLNDEVNRSVPALLSMKQAEISEIASKVDHLDKVQKLRDKYNELNKIEQLNEIQKNELINVVNQLKAEYPTLHVLLDKEGRLHIENINIINDKITAEHNFVNSSANDMRTYLSNLKETTRVQAAEVQTQINNYKKLSAAAQVVNVGKLNSLVGHVSGKVGGIADRILADKYDEYNRLVLLQNDIDKSIASIKTDVSSGVGASLTGSGRQGFSGFSTKAPKSSSSKGSNSDISGKNPAEKAYLEALQHENDLFQFKRAKKEDEVKTIQDHITRLNEIYKKHYAYLKTNESERLQLFTQTANSENELHEAKKRKQQEQEDLVRKGFEHSKKWIEENTYFGKLNLEEQLSAWERVQARYKFGSEEQKEGAREIYRLKKELSEKAEKEEKDRADKLKTIADDIVNAYKENYQKQKEIALDAIDEEARALEKLHKQKLDQLDLEMQKFEESINKQLKLLDEQTSAEDYNKKLSKAQKEAMDIQKKLDVNSLDDSLEARAKREELEKQMAEKKQEIEEMQSSHSKDLRKQNLQEQLDAYKKDSDAKKKAEDAKYNAEKESLDNRKRETERYYENLLNDERKFSEIRHQIMSGNLSAIESDFAKFKTFLDSNMKTIGESISRNLIDKMDQARQSINNVMGISPSSPSATSSSSSKNPIATLINGTDFNIKNGKAIASVSKLAQLIGISSSELKWNDNANSVSVKGKSFAALDNINGRAYVSVADFLSSFGRDYEWVGNNKSIKVYHDGGWVGSGILSKGMDAFRNLFRLKSNEQLSILQDGEFVLSRGMVNKIQSGNISPSNSTTNSTNTLHFNPTFNVTLQKGSEMDAKKLTKMVTDNLTDKFKTFGFI